MCTVNVTRLDATEVSAVRMTSSYPVKYIGTINED